MVQRFVSVGDDFTLPPSVKAADGNMPAHAKAAALDATYGKKVGVNLADYATLKLAIAALPADGGTVFVPIGRHASGDWTYDTDYMNKPGVRIVGEKAPRLSANADRLEGGSVIYGRFNVFADGFEARDVGFDLGKFTCDALYPTLDTHTANHPLGGTWDGLAFAQPNMTTPLPSRKDFKAFNVIGLLRDSQSVGHAILMEGIDGGTADNITGVGGVHAVVVKSQNMRIGKLFGWAGSNNNIIFKSDSYAPCGNISVDYMEAIRNPPNCTPWFTPAIASFGFQTNPASASFTGPLQIGTLKTLGAGNGWCITGGPTYVLADVQVNKIIADGWTGTMSAGINFYGTRAMRIQVGELIVNNASQGLAWNPATSGDNTQHQISIGSAKFTNTTVRAVNASGNARVRIGTLEVATAPQAYYIDDGARLMIGKETLIAVSNKWERAGRPALATGWADFGGGASTFDVVLENYGVSIKGLLTASAGSTGILANVPAYLRPTQGKRLPGSLTKAGVPGFGQIGVSTGGAIDINNNTTQANGDYVSVDGVNWQHW